MADPRDRATMRRGVACLAALILIWTVVACAAPQPTTASIVLTVATPDSVSGGQEVRQLKHFGDEVRRLSGGTITLDVQWYDGPDGAPRLDQDVAELVIKNKVDLAMVPARAWDEEGVTTLRALSAPFLITDDTTVQKVLADAGLRRRLLSGLTAADVLGLDLWPEQPQHLFGFSAALASPADLRGQVVLSPWSRIEWSVLRAWGARPMFGPIDRTRQAGMQSSYDASTAGNVAGNLTPFADVSTVVASRALHQRLSSAQWNLLHRAAQLTRAWAVADLAPDRDSAAQFCADGGRIVAADQGDRDALGRAAEPVTAALRKDPATASLIDDIRALREKPNPPAPTTRCPVDATTEAALVLDGVYSFDVSVADLKRFHVVAAEDLQENSGYYEWTFDHGHWDEVQTGDHEILNPWGAGAYSYDGNTITLIPDDDHSRFGGNVIRDADGGLIFSNVVDSRRDRLGVSRALLLHTWKRVGLVRSGGS